MVTVKGGGGVGGGSGDGGGIVWSKVRINWFLENESSLNRLQLH